jgi:RHS repeat-associated protein
MLAAVLLLLGAVVAIPSAATPIAPDPLVRFFKANERCTFDYRGPEAGLESAFEALFNSGECPLGCGRVDATVYPETNQIHWQWTECGAILVGYSELPCPQGYRPSAGRCPDGGCCEANPIHPASGNKLEQVVDYAGVGALGLTFARSYNSLGGPAHGPLGARWSHTYQRALRRVAGGGLRSVALQRASGALVYFTETAPGRWQPMPGVTGLLEASATGWTFVDADNVVEHYDASGRLVALDLAGAGALRLEYAADRLAAVRDDAGRALQLAYDAGGGLQELRDPGGGRYRYAYDGRNRLVAVTYPDASERHYHYESAAHPYALTGVSDETGTRLASWSYDAQGRAISSAHAGSERFSLAYAADGTTAVTDPAGETRSYRFALQHGVHKVLALDGAGRSRSVTYDANGFIASRTDFAGTLTTYTRDARGRELSRTAAAGTPTARTVTTTWHPRLHLPLTIREAQQHTRFVYDADGRLLSRTDSAEHTRRWRYTYTARGRLASIDGPRTDAPDLTRYTYDAAGDLASLTDPNGLTTRILARDAHGRVLRSSDPNGVLTTLTYDPRGRVTSRTVGGATTTYAYHRNGQLRRVRHPDATTLTLLYDPAGHLLGLVDALGNRIRYVRDGAGQLLTEQVLDATGTPRRLRRWRYDAVGRPAQRLGAAGQSERYAYTPHGALASLTDPNGATTTFAYDPLGRLQQAQDPAGGLTRYAYDAADRLLALTDPSGRATTFAYDGLGNRRRETSPATGLTTYTYDAADNLTTRTDARLLTSTLTYDAGNRLTRIDYPDQTLTYAYDAGPYGRGRLSGFSDPAGATARSHDAHGQVRTETRTLAGLDYVTRYAYDAPGRLHTLHYPSGRSLSYTFDAAGRPRTLTTTYHGLTETLASAITYHPFGPRTGLTLGNGLAVSADYDLDQRLVASTLPEPRTHHYDAAGQLLASDSPERPALAERFAYDANARLTAAVGPYGTRAYAYDALGNRTALTVNALLYPYAYDPETGRLVASAGPTALRLTYDAAGHPTARAQRRLHYNGAGRLARIDTTSAPLADYAYNALGQRVVKHTPGATTLYHYDTRGRLLAESTPTGSFLAEYLYLEDTPIAVALYAAGRPQDLNADARIDAADLALLEAAIGSTVGPDDPRDLDADGTLTTTDRTACARTPVPATRLLYLHTDALGTPRAATDASARLLWRWTTEPFASGLPEEDPDGDGLKTRLHLRRPGQYYDTESGLHYNYFRTYDPATGRYLESDPIGLEGGVNLYVYAGGNPVSRVDPFGLDWLYSQSTGQMSHVDSNGNSTDVGSGYAGHGEGVNNPAMQDVQHTGPLPQGTYAIAPQQDNTTGSGTTLPGSMRLTPDPANEMHGRGGFLIHGDNSRADRSASEGCIIMNRDVRNHIGDSNDPVLRVVP